MSNPDVPDSVHYKVGVLTRQLHDSLNELGYADRLRGSMGELPDAQSRLSYIARLTGEAAEKVLNRVELAKSQQDRLAERVRAMRAQLVEDPVAAVAKGRVMNFLEEVEQDTIKVGLEVLETKRLDQRLSEVEDQYLKSLGAEKRCAGASYFSVFPFSHPFRAQSMIYPCKSARAKNWSPSRRAQRSACRGVD